jgi:hypothetical protein
MSVVAAAAVLVKSTCARKRLLTSYVYITMQLTLRSTACCAVLHEHEFVLLFGLALGAAHTTCSGTYLEQSQSKEFVRFFCRESPQTAGFNSHFMPPVFTSMCGYLHPGIIYSLPNAWCSVGNGSEGCLFQ